MTLITHLWNKNYHIVAADGCIATTIHGVVTPVSNDFKKIINYSNGFLAFSFNGLTFEQVDEYLEDILAIQEKGSRIADIDLLIRKIRAVIRSKNPDADITFYLSVLKKKKCKTVILKTLSGKITSVPKYCSSFNGEFKRL